MPRRQRRTLELAIHRGSTHMAVMLVLLMALTIASVVARRLSMACALVTLVVMVNFVYLGVYALRYYDVIDDDRCESLIEIVQGWSLVGNLFSPTPHTIRPWPRHILAMVTRFVTRLLATRAEEERGRQEEELGVVLNAPGGLSTARF
eukprot:g5680.t1